MEIYMPVELKSLLAVIPVDISALINIVNDYELKIESLSSHFSNLPVKCSKFTEQVVCFLTTCDLYDEPEYEVILQQWLAYIKPFLDNESIRRYYQYLLKDARTLSLSTHYAQRLDYLLNHI